MADVFQEIGEALTIAVERLDNVYQEKDARAVSGLATGFHDLDRMTSGLQPGDLIVVAGRPSMGKTAFVLNIAEHIALDGEKAVVVYSMEMKGEQLASRMLGSVGRIDPFKMRSPLLMEEDEWQRLTYALGKLNEAPIFLRSPSDTTWTAATLREHLENAVEDAALIIVDGVQFLDVTNVATSYDRNIQLGEQVRQLKKMALDLNIPIILTSPLGREVENRPNKRGIPRDLRDIGMLEDIADLILFVYRDEVYNPDSPDQGMAEIIIGKQRNGPTGTVRLLYLNEYTSFENYARP